MKSFCLLIGPFSSRSGYGEHARDFFRSLKRVKSSDWEFMLFDLPWGSTPRNSLVVGKDDDIINAINSNRQLPRQPDVVFHISVPNEFQPVGKFNVGVTAGIETTTCKPEWIEGCNRMNLVITTSEHSKHVFQNSRFDKINKRTNQKEGVLELTTPVVVLFEGVDTELFQPKPDVVASIAATLAAITEQHCFLFVGHWLPGNLGQDRKDIGMLVKTFCETFKNKKDAPALILKTSYAGFSIMERQDIEDKINEIKSGVKGDLPNIYLLYGDLEAEEMASLYNHPKVKSMVSFTKGEGFGRPLLEFAQYNKPVIASKWSGHLDFLPEDKAILLPGKLTPVHSSAVREQGIVQESSWFTVDYVQAAQTLARVYKDYNSQAKRAQKLTAHCRDAFNMDKADAKLAELLTVHVTVAKPLELKLPTLKRIELPKLQKK